MRTRQNTVSAALAVAGTAPAGTTPARSGRERLRAAYTVLPTRAPLDSDELDAERAWQAWRRWNHEDM